MYFGVHPVKSLLIKQAVRSNFTKHERISDAEKKELPADSSRKT